MTTRKPTEHTGLVLVTHGNIGQAMIEVAEFILGESLADIQVLPFRQSAMQATGDDEVRATITKADRGQGVLVMTDIGGASPCNHVSRVLPASGAVVVSGLNLAMLLRVWNYRSKPVAQLAKLASEGAIRDIRECGK